MLFFGNLNVFQKACYFILLDWFMTDQARSRVEKKNNFRLYNHTGVAGRVTCGGNISMSEMFLFSEELKLTFFFPMKCYYCMLLE